MDKIIAFFTNFLNKISKTNNKNINKTDSKENISPTITGIGKVVTITDDKVEPFKVTEVTNKKEKIMGYNFGKRSRARLDTCHPDLVKVLETVIKVYDFSIIEGLRTAETQAQYFKDGKSQLDGVKRKSKHQDDGSGLSRAVDILPYYKGFNPFTSENGPKSFYYLAGLVHMAAQTLYDNGEIEHLIRWGGNWDGDMDFFGDSSFFDLPHFELIKPKK
jgi:peptidoglycan L-alanyl-D-glutamate endopeptidase CwlK